MYVYAFLDGCFVYYIVGGGGDPRFGFESQESRVNSAGFVLAASLWKYRSSI